MVVQTPLSIELIWEKKMLAAAGEARKLAIQNASNKYAGDLVTHLKEFANEMEDCYRLVSDKTRRGRDKQGDYKELANDRSSVQSALCGCMHIYI